MRTEIARCKNLGKLILVIDRTGKIRNYKERDWCNYCREGKCSYKTLISVKYGQLFLKDEEMV